MLKFLFAVRNLSPLLLSLRAWKDIHFWDCFHVQFSLFSFGHRFYTLLRTGARATEFHDCHWQTGFSCWLSRAWKCTSAPPAAPWCAPSMPCVLGASPRPCTGDWIGRPGPSWRHSCFISASIASYSAVVSCSGPRSSAGTSSCLTQHRQSASCGAWRRICAAWPASYPVYQLAAKDVRIGKDRSHWRGPSCATWSPL